MRGLLAAAVALLVVGVVACSEDLPATAPEPVATASPAAATAPEPTSEPPAAPVAEVAPPEASEIEPEPEEKPAPVLVATEPPIAATATPSEPELPALPDPVEDVDQEPTSEPPAEPVIESIPPVKEFANVGDAALIYRDGFGCYDGCWWDLPLYRIYKRGGELVKEALFTEDHPMIQAIEPYRDNAVDLYLYLQVEVIATADGSRMVAVLCHGEICGWHGPGGLGYSHTDLPLPITDLYESTDGGVTWQHIDTVERPWIPLAITSGGDGREPLLLLYSLSLSVPIWDAYMLRSGGEVEVDVLEETRPSEEWPASELAKRVEAEGPQESPHDRFTGQIPTRGSGPGYEKTTGVHLLAVQHGPFLRVVDDVDGCLPIRADPSPDAAELACMAPRVLLQDQEDKAEGSDWYQVKTPAGVVGWADNLYVE